MIDHKLVKLGKGPARNDSRTLRLAKYFLESLPPAPASVDYTSGITEWGMMLNDSLGDCTIAGCGHAEQVWSAARGGEYTLPDSAILQKYKQWCGYVDGDPSTDQGGNENDVLNDWRKTGFWKHALLGYADPEPTNLEHVKQAIYLFGGVYIGVQLPVSAQNQTTWDVVSGSDGIPGSWGGHCVFVPKYETLENGQILFTCITWGGLLGITQAFWTYNNPENGPYVDEVHALVAPEFVNAKTGATPEGLDLAAMEADVQLVAA